jgi:hypothetical protein
MKTIEQPSLEQLAQRKAALERKQRQRARDKAKSHPAMVDRLERVKGDKMNAEGLKRSGGWMKCEPDELSAERSASRSSQPQWRVIKLPSTG